MTLRRTLFLAFSITFVAAQIARGGTVEYSVTFDATWSQATHPTDWPSNAHFSSLIGGTHNANVKFWEQGAMATVGIQLMAERGATQPLRDEVNTAIAAGNAYAVIAGPAISHPPAKVSTNFVIDSNFPLVTLVTMIAPSPDWFVGVSGLELFKNGAWQNDVVVDLLPYDAGTDSGATFTSPDLVTSPHIPISHITTAPFLNTPPLGTFSFHLLAANPADVNGDGIVNGQDLTLVASNWLQTGNPATLAGDANNDGVVNGQDVTIIASNWLAIGAGGGGGAAAAVPEPTTMILAALGGLFLLAYRAGRALNRRIRYLA